ncbi:MAG TPA: DUF3579 domain-containing protein [Thiobacillus sp.]
MPENTMALYDTPGNSDSFQPAVWIETLASILASFLADPRLRYEQGVQPNVVDGELCLLVATWLETTNRESYDYVMAFAKANQVETKLDRRTGERAIQPPG